MGSILTVDIFLSVDGWAGSDGLPGYFGYLGPELQDGSRPSWLHRSSWSWGGEPTRLWRGSQTRPVTTSPGTG
jgi:hypothetical protein